MAAGVLAAAGFVGVAATAAPMAHGPEMAGLPFHGPMVDRMLDRIDATPDQRAQVKQISDAAMADLKSQHAASHELHQREMALFTQPTVDANAAEALRQQLLSQHDQASRRMMQAMLEISRVLTPEQRQKLATLASEHGERMHQHMRGRPDAQAPATSTN